MNVFDGIGSIDEGPDRPIRIVVEAFRFGIEMLFCRFIPGQEGCRLSRFCYWIKRNIRCFAWSGQRFVCLDEKRVGVHHIYDGFVSCRSGNAEAFFVVPLSGFSVFFGVGTKNFLHVFNAELLVRYYTIGELIGGVEGLSCDFLPSNLVSGEIVLSFSQLGRLVGLTEIEVCPLTFYRWFVFAVFDGFFH